MPYSRNDYHGDPDDGCMCDSDEYNINDPRMREHKHIKLLRQMQEGRRGDLGTVKMWTPKAPTIIPMKQPMMIQMSCAFQ